MMTNASGGTGSIDTGGLDPVKMWEITMDMLILGLMCVVLHHPMGVVGLKQTGEEVEVMNLWKELNKDLVDVVKSMMMKEMNTR